ncbi:hypothetical protein [Luteibacter sp. 9135]|uniref:hypothetical protein n=1 Tax=Luteibacter sp. 9135 TaxID=1500893 RepID=UPI00055AC4F3|nr:hypothetical protein [Luteibacter sp. 9135]
MTTMNDQQDHAALDSVISGARATGNVSPALNLNVLKPGASDTRLPRPAITDANGEELDLGVFPDDTTITCAPWPLIAVGQKVWLDVDGTLDDGTATTRALLTASAVTAAQVRNGLSLPLPRTWLESLRDGSSVTVRLAATLNGSTDTFDKINFPLASYTLRSGGGLEDFETAPVGAIVKLVDRPLCTLAPPPTGLNCAAISERGTAGKLLNVYAVYSHPITAQTYVTPKRTTRSIAFDYDDNQAPKEYPCSVYIYFADGTVEQVLLKGQGRYSSPVRRVISRLIFTVSSYGSLYIDNILFRA